MPTDQALEVLIRTILDSKGFEQLKVQLKESAAATKGHAEATRGGTREAEGFRQALGEVGKKLAEQAVELFAVREALGFFRESLKEAVEAARAMDQFAAANKAVGDAAEGAAEKNERWINTVEVVTGKGETELVPMYIKLLAATNDAAQAQALLQIVAGAAAAGFGDMETNAQLLSKAMIGGVIKPSTALGIEFKKLKEAGHSTAEIFEILGKRFGDAGASIKNAGLEADRAKRYWLETKEAVGTLGLGLVQYLKPALHGVALAIGLVIGGLIKTGGAIAEVMNLIAGFSRVTFALLNRDAAGASKALRETLDAAGEAWKKTSAEATDAIEKIEAVFNRTMGDLRDDTAEQARKAGEHAGKHKKTIEEVREEYRKLELQLRRTAAGEEEFLRGQIKLMAQMSKDSRLQAKDQLEALDRLKEISRELAGLQVRDSKAAEQAGHNAFENWLRLQNSKIRHYEKDTALILKIQESGLGDMRNADAKYLLSLAASYEAAAKMEMLSQEKRTEYAQRGAEIREAVARRTTERIIALGQATMSFAREVFGESKELSIAEAIINTYAGAAKALEQKGWLGIALAAIIIATGLAYVAKMAGTGPGGGGAGAGGGTTGGYSVEAGGRGYGAGGGFDNPKNDFAAYVGGQQWARDMIEDWSVGAAAGFRMGMTAQQATYDNRTTINEGSRTSHYTIQSQGLLDTGSDVIMRRFVRKLQTYQALEDQRTLR